MSPEQAKRLLGAGQQAYATFLKHDGSRQYMAAALVAQAYSCGQLGDYKQALELISQARKLDDAPQLQQMQAAIELALNSANRSSEPSVAVPSRPTIPVRTVQVPINNGTLIDDGHAIVEQVLDDHLLVQTAKGYGIIELYAGSGLVDEGDTIVGSVDEYGLHDLHDATKDESISGYVDEFGLTREEAMEKLIEAKK